MEYESYKKHVTAALADITTQELTASVRASNSSFPYTLVQTPVSSVLADCRHLNLPWHVLVGIRGWMRLRANFVELATVGRGSRCIFCGTLARDAGASRRRPVHVLGKCQTWSAERALIEPFLECDLSRPDQVSMAILKVMPSSPMFELAVPFCAEVDKAARDYWSEA